MKIEGTLALVTGGCGGLGRAIADGLQERGCRVVAADFNDHALAALPSGMIGLLMDVTDPANVAAALSELCETHGCPEILVNCAGRIVSSPFLNIFNPDQMMLPYAQFRADLLINLDYVFIVSSVIVEHMVRNRKNGCIINISSISARGNAGQTSYAAAKAAVEAMTVTWSKELGGMGIRCNCIAPGFIDTPSTHMALRPEQIKHIVSSTPLRRLGNSREIAQAVLALAENDFINGAILAVNGGLTI